jgi:hypothetical protein
VTGLVFFPFEALIIFFIVVVQSFPDIAPEVEAVEYIGPQKKRRGQRKIGARAGHEPENIVQVVFAGRRPHTILNHIAEAQEGENRRPANLKGIFPPQPDMRSRVYWLIRLA